MDISEIREYAQLMDELGLTGLEVGEGAERIRLEKAPAQAAAGAILSSVQAVPGENGADVQPGPGYIRYDEVTSPMVGVFYSAPTENDEPYVKVGDRVKRGDTLCIIEAMKLMNEITAEEDGVIREICVSNAQVVEYGTVLFRMEN